MGVWFDQRVAASDPSLGQRLNLKLFHVLLLLGAAFAGRVEPLPAADGQRRLGMASRAGALDGGARHSLPSGI